MATALTALREHLAPIQDLAAIGMGLAWDHQVMMPARGAAHRGEVMGTVEAIHHERFTSATTGRLLEAAEKEVEAGTDDPLGPDLVAVTRRDWEKACRVPQELAVALARASTDGYEAWLRAREASDFALFKPQLTNILALKERYAECFPDADCAYDALLDDFEPGATTAEVRAVFDELKTGLVPLVSAALEHADRVDDACLTGDFPPAAQEALIRQVLEHLGFTPESWRLDVAVHPFAASLNRQDIRITTRYDPRHLAESFFSGLHEAGHGLYEAGSAPELERTPLAGGASLGLHESQSRLWENLVGRSRPFADWVLPIVRRHLPEAFAGVDAEAWYRAVNTIRRSLIRVEADEATYSLHVILRFELEQDMIERRISLDDLPEAWNQKMRDYLGVEVPDDARGVLQDVHWSEGHVGYFPTYALGNIMSAQIWAAARAGLPGLDDSIRAGSFGPLREWLGEHLHRHGRRSEPRETLVRVAGGPLDAGPYLAYLHEKFTPLYGLDGA